jgi:hypothetical protein
MVKMELSETQRRELYQTGLVRLPQTVPRNLVEAALHAINASLGDRGIDQAMLPLLRARSYCPELVGTPPITDLYNSSPLPALVESLVGPGSLRPITSGQIALRFPSNTPPLRVEPHIDGMHSPNNGVPRGTIASFTALVGVFLSDVPHEDMGNFTVWPGSHHVLERYFRDYGPQSLLDGFPPADIGHPKQVTAQAGDAVLCHYQLAHGIAGNSSPFIRYGIFFRLSHIEHEGRKWECMTDIWREWRGIEASGRPQGTIP